MTDQMGTWAISQARMILSRSLADGCTDGRDFLFIFNDVCYEWAPEGGGRKWNGMGVTGGSVLGPKHQQTIGVGKGN